MTAGSGKSVPAKREYDYNAGSERRRAERSAGDASDVAGASGVTTDLEDKMTGASSWSGHGASLPAGEAGSESNHGAGAPVAGDNAVHTGRAAFATPAQPSFRGEETHVANNGSSSKNEATELRKLAALGVSNLGEAAATTSSHSIGSSRIAIALPPVLAAPSSTSNGDSDGSTSFRSHDESTAVTTPRNGSSHDESSVGPSLPISVARFLSSSQHDSQQTAEQVQNMTTHAEMEEPIGAPEGVQFDEYVKILKEQKTAQIALYKETNNQGILKLNWETRNHELNHELKHDFNRAFIWGDWVRGAKLNNFRDIYYLPAPALNRTFIDIEIKRIASNDHAILEACGVHPDFAFLGLVGDKAATGSDSTEAASASTAATIDSRPSTASTVAGMASSTPGGWPVERGTTATVERDTATTAEGATAGKELVALSRAAGPATETETETETKSETETETATHAVVPSTPGAWPAEAADKPSPARSSSAATGVLSTGAIALVSRVSQASRASRASSASTLASQRAPTIIINPTPSHLRESTWAARTRLYEIVDGCRGFEQLKAKSAIYLVRVVAIPGPSEWCTTGTNHFRGPVWRQATLCGLGGWIVPDASALRGTSSPPAGSIGCKDGSLLATPVNPDWTFATQVSMEGNNYVPLWTGAEEPNLEDVYHMVWELVAGRQFVGLVRGHGFGRRFDGDNPYPFDALREENPFQSPSHV